MTGAVAGLCWAWWKTCSEACGTLAAMGIQCSRHQRELYEDTRDGQPMSRWLCPEPGCESVLADVTIAAMRDQAWCSDNGMTAPGWQTLTVRTVP